MNHAIIIFSFNRPDTLNKCLKSIQTQNMIDKFDVYLYQDNYYNVYSKKEKCNQSLIHESIDVFKKTFQMV